ncbi:MAG: S41 family peptidase [bacterium]|nr:S41 family peptidase [bacterium]
MNELENNEISQAAEDIKKKKRNGKIKLAAAFILTVALTASVTSCVCNIGYINSTEKTAAYQQKLNKVKELLDKHYLYDIDEEETAEKAVAAYVEGLDEPYTHYYTKKEFEDFTSNIEDSYVGIGIVISMNDNNQIEVVAPFEGSPAYAAGVLPRDILKSVNGVEYSGDKMEEAVNVITGGKAGTTVELVFVRDGKEISMTIERGDISSESVSTEMLDGNIGLVRISSFNTNSKGSKQDTYTEFKEKVEQMQAEGMEKMIIDLRDNPGGSLDIVCEISDMIVPEGLITYMEYKDGKREEFKSDANEMNIPICVLINENSASASEVLTGCLKDYKKATVIGKTSYGKGIVQSVYPFMDGSGISMTVAKYYSPSGVCIHGTGITPDIEVDMPEEFKQYYASSVPHDNDTQLQKAVEVLRNTE